MNSRFLLRPLRLPFLLLLSSGLSPAFAAPSAYEKALELLESTATALRSHHPERDPRVPNMTFRELESLRHSLYGRYMTDDPTAPPPGTPVAEWDNFYNLDALRGPVTALAEGIGGACNTHARALAQRLRGFGYGDESVRVLSAVRSGELAALCPRRGRPLSGGPQEGLSGHVFLLLENGAEGWRLLDSSFQPSLPQGASAPFLSPTEIDAALAAGQDLRLPAEAVSGMPEFLRDLRVFHLVAPSNYPAHTYLQRPSLIASGQVDSPVCRFGR